jgi:transcription elongation factor GreA
MEAPLAFEQAESLLRHSAFHLLRKRATVKAEGGVRVNYHPITPAGLAALQAQVVALQRERPAKIAQLAAAAALGDRSENADYSAAKRDLRHLESRLRYLDKLIRYAQVIPAPTGEQVAIGTRVTIAFAPDDRETYRVVGPKEAGLAPDNLAADSPLGAALLGQRTGATVTVQAPAGRYPVTVVAITV